MTKIADPINDLATNEATRVLAQANKCLDFTLPAIIEISSPHSPGTPQDFFSESDYWWPEPKNPDAPYVRHDGETNPDNFYGHRILMRQMKDQIALMAAAYKISGDEAYAIKGVEDLVKWFVSPETRMQPHLNFAQSVRNICIGRPGGIIDGLHLAEIPFAIKALESSKAMTEEIYSSLKTWFSELLDWFFEYPFGRLEWNSTNNHGCACLVQMLSYGIFTQSEKTMTFCRQHWLNQLLPQQLAKDGSFPNELKRTKPYNYSIFNLDMMALIAHMGSQGEHNLWQSEFEDGRKFAQAFDFLFPFIKDKSKWPYHKDVEHFDSLPVRHISFLLAGLAYDRNDFIQLWNNLEPEPEDQEIRRNMAVTQPVLWVG